MRKLRLLSALVVLGLVAFVSSCGKNGMVTVTVTPETVTAAPGEVVYFAFTLTADAAAKGELGDFKVSDNVGDGHDIFTYAYSGDGSTGDSVKYTVPADAAEGTDITLTFEATDGKSGEKTVKTATITVASGVPETVTASATANYKSTSLKNQMMFDLKPTGVEMKGGDFSDGELAFVWQNSYAYSIVSPDNPWITALFKNNGITYTTSDKQNTKIMKYNGDFASLDKKTLANLEIKGETVNGGNGLTNLNVGDVVVFETQDGRKGALKVGSNAKVEKSMTAELIYQAEGTSAK